MRVCARCVRCALLCVAVRFCAPLCVAGFLGYFKGNLTNVLRAAPSAAVRFRCFEYVKKLFISKNESEKERKKLTDGQNLVSGAGTHRAVPFAPCPHFPGPRVAWRGAVVLAHHGCVRCRVAWLLVVAVFVVCCVVVCVAGCVLWCVLCGVVVCVVGCVLCGVVVCVVGCMLCDVVVCVVRCCGVQPLAW